MARKKEDAVIDMGKWRLDRFGRPLLAIFVIAAVFTVGLNIGNGRISLHLHHASSVNSSLPDKLDYSSVNQVYQTLKENYDGKLTTAQLLDGLKEGLAESTNDPYTEYFPAKQAQEFQNQLEGTFSGIGAQLGKDADGNLEVIAPIAGTPAAKAGLKAKDIITEVNGEPTAKMSIDQAVNKIRGKKGTTVTLQIVRDKNQTLTVKIVRDDITIPSVNSKILDGNIGYMQITQFSNDTGKLATQAAQKFADKHVKGVILDLRSNPGGLLNAAIDVSSLWLPEGKTVLTERQGSTVLQTYNAEGNDILHGIPTVVLIDGGSASAAEITAGALHDNKAATLIGEKSYGKGVVQQIINFGDGSELKVTVASWYRPNGQNINHKGITPDQKVSLNETDAKAGKDTQLQAAQDYLNK
ncbi:MAG TPA: S41 family peptidase [Candidatus Saccharimonadales bacterium]|nr:S41 family peptidase [Candidatus Saccharimonadales bacterium]